MHLRPQLSHIDDAELALRTLRRSLDECEEWRLTWELSAKLASWRSASVTGGGRDMPEARQAYKVAADALDKLVNTLTSLGWIAEEIDKRALRLRDAAERFADSELNELGSEKDLGSC